MGVGVATLKPSLANLSLENWLSRLAALAEGNGDFQRLGANHTAAFFDRGDHLLVTFDTLRAARANGERALPAGFELAEDHGWSHLVLLADRPMWFRDPDVYSFFDQLVDDDFTGDFDQVVFFGEGMCGYGAAAFSVVSPGATVIALAPQATLDPRRAGWDHRFMAQRLRSFTDRYGYAPDMLDGCRQAFVIFDPEQELDAMHATLFHAPYTALMPCRFLGAGLAAELHNMGMLDGLITAAMDDEDVRRVFWRTYHKARKTYLPYLRRLRMQADDDGRSGLCLILDRHLNQTKALANRQDHMPEPG